MVSIMHIDVAKNSTIISCASSTHLSTHKAIFHKIKFVVILIAYNYGYAHACTVHNLYACMAACMYNGTL